MDKIPLDIKLNIVSYLTLAEILPISISTFKHQRCYRTIKEQLDACLEWNLVGLLEFLIPSLDDKQILELFANEQVVDEQILLILFSTGILDSIPTLLSTLQQSYKLGQMNIILQAAVNSDHSYKAIRHFYNHPKTKITSLHILTWKLIRKRNFARGLRERLLMITGLWFMATLVTLLAILLGSYAIFLLATIHWSIG